MKGAQITAAGARSKVGSSILAGIGTVGKAVTKAGLSFGSTGSVGGPLTTTRGSIFDDPFDRP